MIRFSESSTLLGREQLQAIRSMTTMTATQDAGAALAASEPLEIVNIQGVRVPIDPRLMSEMMQKVIRSGRYEGSEAARIPMLVEAGERVLEIGGGIGFLSTLIAKENKAETIVVFEANPGLIELIETTHRLNGVQAIVRNEIIMGRKTGDTLPFYLHQHFWASSMMWVKKRHCIGVVQIPQVAFAEVLRDYAPTLLVVDIEGGEFSLFDNVDLTTVRKALIEVHEKVIGGAGVKSVFDFFSAQGFYYDPLGSEGRVVLFRRLEETPAS